MSWIKREIDYPDISVTQSKFKKFIGIPTLGQDGDLMNGESKLKDGTIIRFVNGFIDGNVYDARGEVLYTYPAIEYDRGQEYWTKGTPHGFPAISLALGLYEEYWADGRIVKIKETLDAEFSFYDDDYELDDEEYSEDYDSDDEDSFEDYEDVIDDITDFKKEYEINLENFSKYLDNSLINIDDEEIDEILSYDKAISFQDRLMEIMRIRKRTDPEVYHPIFMREKAFNKIKNAKPNESISLNNAIMIAFSLNLTFEQMVRFTNFAGKGFRNYGTRDEIIKKFFDSRNYRVFELNTELVKHNEEPFFEPKDDNLRKE